MEILYAPWRSKYINKNNNNCPFCDIFKQDKDEKNFVLKRYKHTVAMLNLHPYNAGHILILPYAHKANLYDLTSEERVDLIEALSELNLLVKNALRCDGVNIGVNAGKASGGSIPDHLHLHVVPRWLGDTNFLVVTADTKQISVDLNQMYTTLKEAIHNVNN